MKILTTVCLAASLVGCTTPVKDRNAAAQGATPSSEEVVPAPRPPATAAAVPHLPAASASAPAAPAAGPSSSTGSAYLGCGIPIPPERLWDETTEGEVLEAVALAKDCAARHGRRLLLEFVAPWCGDCREMARLDQTALVHETLRARFERVRINVGKWDRHEGLRETHGVRALATYVVIDPRTSRVVAQTTLEPVSRKQGKKLTAEDWANWLKQH